MRDEIDQLTTIAAGIVRHSVQRRDPAVTDRYAILGIIGSGGMGNVYRVHDRELDEVVALKTLKLEAAKKEHAIEQFRDEVRLARRVTHRNVARTYDIGSIDGVFYLTMEYVEGESLGEVIAVEGYLGAGRALDIADQIAAGLEAAHGAGIVHRDLKPGNIIIDADGRAVISDFGIASLAGARPGRIVGTPAYMAPEQRLGAEVDGRTDIYALGVILFEMLVGRRPVDGSSAPDPKRRPIEEAPPLRTVLPRVPQAIASLVDRCLALQPGERYPTVAALRADLHKARAIASVDWNAPGARPTHRTGGRETTIAVLPLRCLAAQEHIARGFQEELLRGLGKCRGLVPVAAQETDIEARVVVDGTIVVEGDTLTVDLVALCAVEGFELWSARIERPTSQTFWIAHHAVRAIADVLTTAAGDEAVSALVDPLTIDTYLRARYITNVHWASPTLLAPATRELWERLLKLAPSDSRVLAGAATYFARAATLSDSDESADMAADLAERAIAAAPDWAEPRCARATVLWHRMRLTEALEAARDAVELDPRFALGWRTIGKILLETGPIDEAISALRRAHELQRTDPHVHWELARAHAFLEDWDEVDRLLAQDVDGGAVGMRGMLRLRLDLWRPEPAWLNAPLDMKDIDPDALFFAAAAQYALRTGRIHPAFEGAIIGYAHGKPRLAAIAYQAACEVALKVGDLARAETALNGAIEAELRDLMWLERCPALAPLRGTRAWGDGVRVVRDRLFA